MNRLRKTARMEALVESSQDEVECERRCEHCLTKAELRLRSRKGKLFFYGDVDEEVDYEDEAEDMDEPMEEEQDQEMEDCCQELGCLYDMEIEDNEVSSAMHEDMEAEEQHSDNAEVSVQEELSDVESDEEKPTRSQPIAVPCNNNSNTCTAVMIHQPRTPPICYLPLSPPNTPPSPSLLVPESYSQIARKFRQDSPKPDQPLPQVSSVYLSPPISLSAFSSLTPPSPHSKITLLPAARNLSSLIDAAASSPDATSLARPSSRNLAGLLALQTIDRPLASRRNSGEKHQRKVRNMRLKPKRQRPEPRPSSPPSPATSTAPAISPLEYERQFPPLKPPRRAPAPSRRPRPPRPAKLRKGGKESLRKMRARGKKGRY